MPTGVYERKPKPLEDPLPRFWKRVEKTATCWLWKGPVRGGGYGQFWYRGKTTPASRFIYEHTYGQLPPELKVCHTCDTPACVRLDHLFAGTVQDNVQDAISKGRWNYEKRESPNYTRGADNSKSKVTDDDVREIRRAYKPRRVGSRWDADAGPSLVDLGKKYGLTKYAVWSILKRLTWKHIT